MILECSICSKRYELSRSKLPQPHQLPSGHFGWCLSCDSCQSNWVLNQSLLDKTSEDLQDPVPLSIVSETSSKKSLKEALASLKKLTPQKSWGWLLGHGTWKRAVGALACLALVSWTSHSLLQKSYPPFPTKRDPLVVQEVRSSIQKTEKGKEILVSGEILNRNPVSVNMLPLRVMVWGEKDQGSKNSVISSWNHQWARREILPGERVSFQTAQALTEDLKKILKIEVTLP